MLKNLFADVASHLRSIREEAESYEDAGYQKFQIEDAGGIKFDVYYEYVPEEGGGSTPWDPEHVSIAAVMADCIDILPKLRKHEVADLEQKILKHVHFLQREALMDQSRED